MMLRAILVVLGFLLAASLYGQQKAADQIPAAKGSINITAVGHASLMLQYDNKAIAVDPVNQAGYASLPRPGLILITHTHGDHFVPQAVEALKKADTKILAPPAVKEKLPEAEAISNGQTHKWQDVPIEAVAAYNIERGPSPGTKYHPQGQGNGYVLELGGKRIYIAGDTECTPEVKALKNIDAAFLPMNLPYTMPPEEAAACAKVFRPKIVYPYHYRGSDLSKFQDALKGEKGIEVRLLEWYAR
jgi:L-ascorbate metabolism protein UlaG (beta-lactamase superfamily)